ncbi:hypothetical protein H3H12_00590 [Serratia marcescens]|uniref:DUF2635 domain-containing protein n=1 Tax=Serratia marcescens TaxID=615 RepID=A0ABD5BSI9_SERMA|nr:hypothetical protein [Serratia marcescens]MBN3900797.1 hypothetical protein [Serratia marcescens]MBN3911629.1 hypothetical protein [Serratia marcescens]MBN3917472.1 hypothetical protein [Serratia marcescens]MBN3933441.1 hypothetical protein [Serratia marcescens]MBN3952973.1 hypothetical protein [Serratia marcescens]
MINVIARTGIRVPKEEMPDRYITDSEAVSVAQSAYYRRRLREGDLLLASVTPPGDVPATDVPEQALPAKVKGAK